MKRNIKNLEKLNLGCGFDIRKDFVNLDFVKRNGVDVLHNLNTFPYPFPKNRFSYIYSKHCLEQLWDFREIFKELYRISKNNAIWDIIVFHHSNRMAYQPYHKSMFGFNSFNNCENIEFLEIKAEVSDNKSFFVKILENWINKHKDFYEKTIIKYIFPTFRVTFKIKIKK